MRVQPPAPYTTKEGMETYDPRNIPACWVEAGGKPAFLIQTTEGKACWRGDGGKYIFFQVSVIHSKNVSDSQEEKEILFIKRWHRFITF